MAGAKLSLDTSKPITIGVQMDDRLPTKLNTPPVRPSSRTGASADTSDQVIEASPLPKKATARKKMTQGVESVRIGADHGRGDQQAQDDGQLARQAHRGAAADQKVRQHAEHSTPMKAARKGTEARKPDLMKSMPRYFTR